MHHLFIDRILVSILFCILIYIVPRYFTLDRRKHDTYEA